MTGRAFEMGEDCESGNMVLKFRWEVVTNECGPETASVELGLEALIDGNGMAGTQRTPEQWRKQKMEAHKTGRC